MREYWQPYIANSTDVIYVDKDGPNITSSRINANETWTYIEFNVELC
jgi:hypothetical protein